MSPLIQPTSKTAFKHMQLRKNVEKYEHIRNTNVTGYKNTAVSH